MKFYVRRNGRAYVMFPGHPAPRLLSMEQLIRDYATEELHEKIDRDLKVGVIPLRVSRFIVNEDRAAVYEARMEWMQQSFHYRMHLDEDAYSIRLNRDRAERDYFATHMGRAISNQLADALAKKYRAL